AVAVILFEGGLQLNFHELRDAGNGVGRLVFLGAPIGWGLGGLAARYVGGLDWPVAILFGGLLVVTGPTVIIPLLRQAKLAPRVANILKWEGIVNDPVGALLVVLVFEYLSLRGQEWSLVQTAGWLLLATALAAALGWLLGRLVVFLMTRGHAPEYLKSPLLLGFVLVGFVLGNALEHEVGLVVVTIMGVTLANSRVASIEKIREFKEQVTILLVSAVFVLIAATLTPEILAELDGRAFAFVAVLLLVVRPLTVGLSLLGSRVPWRERLLVGWVAPRGIVAVTIAGVFGPALAREGYPDAGHLVPLTFAVVFATVTLHGFTLAPFGRRLGLSATGRPGVLIVGGSAFAAALGKALVDLEVPVLVTDRIWHRLREPRRAGLPTYFGEILSDSVEHKLDLNRYDHLLALSDNDDYNALVAAELTRNFERNDIYQLAMYNDEYEDRRQVSYRLKGQNLFNSELRYETLAERLRQGWGFRKSTLSERFTVDDWQRTRPEGSEIVCVVASDDAMRFNTPDAVLEPGPGDTILTFAPPRAPTRPEPEAAREAVKPLPG
ncbi:MAG: sodium:proton antiporter, partial [Geminicoccaceae bacterium]|nr:sodium:proton antiporter [Geminicoccaceae bacterium]